MQKIISKSPGEIFFFGEHSVVYGGVAIAAAIDRWVVTTLTPNNGLVAIESSLGKLKAKIDGLKLKVEEVDKSLEPLVHGIERVYGVFKESIGFHASIDSELPTGSGLASSAAVSCSLIGGIIRLMGKEIPRTDMVRLVFQSELDIQKRGSISGSACTVIGGILKIRGDDFNSIGYSEIKPWIIIADSKEQKLTSTTTGWIKQALRRDKDDIESIFNSITSLAIKGMESIANKDWAELGKLMSQNQKFLKRLGVSTDKIDKAISSISSHVLGSKITGAGGGGCFISLCDGENTDLVKNLLLEQDFNVYLCGVVSHDHNFIGV